MTNLITIIIPTYERAKYLSRALFYWLRYPVNIIVVDGSEVPSIEINAFKMYGNLTYCHMPLTIEKRLAYAASILTGKYAIQISDDEFLSYSALVTASKILDEQKNISAVLGATLAFKKIENKFFSSIWYPSAQNLNISGRTPSERLKQRCSVRGNSIYYPLVRVDTMRAALLIVGENHYSCPYVAEYQMEALFCLFGSVKVIPELMWFRSHEVPMINNKNNNRDIFFSEWIKDKNNLFEVEILKKSCSINFNYFENSTGSITADEFIDSFSKFEGNVRQNTIKENISNLMKNCKITKLLLSYINLMRAKFTRNFKNLYEIKIDLEKNKIKYNNEEINIIANIVATKD
jgi:glycosyltransferase domain-containing protein